MQCRVKKHIIQTSPLLHIFSVHLLTYLCYCWVNNEFQYSDIPTIRLFWLLCVTMKNICWEMKQRKTGAKSWFDLGIPGKSSSHFTTVVAACSKGGCVGSTTTLDILSSLQDHDDGMENLPEIQPLNQ